MAQRFGNVFSSSASQVRMPSVPHFSLPIQGVHLHLPGSQWFPHRAILSPGPGHPMASRAPDGPGARYGPMGPGGIMGDPGGRGPGPRPGALGSGRGMPWDAGGPGHPGPSRAQGCPGTGGIRGPEASGPGPIRCPCSHFDKSIFPEVGGWDWMGGAYQSNHISFQRGVGG